MFALPLADGPAMYLGGSIMTFALPYGAFIAAAITLYFLFRARHSGPRLKYLSSAHLVASTTTWEPGPAPAPSLLPRASGTVLPETPAAETRARETDGGRA